MRLPHLPTTKNQVAAALAAAALAISPLPHAGQVLAADAASLYAADGLADSPLIQQLQRRSVENAEKNAAAGAEQGGRDHQLLTPPCHC